MHLIKEVSVMQVKRTFVVGNDTRGHKKEQRKKLTKEKFLKNFAKAEQRAKKLNNVQLDRIIGKEWFKRRDAYNSMRWYLGIAKINEVAVWRGAGGLPLTWTKGSLSVTGQKVGLALQKKSKLLKKRARLAIPGILENSLEAVQHEKYLLPIILPAGTLKGCRGNFKKFKGDIDDGCMRSIALAVSGKKIIKAYIGVRKADI